MDLVIDTSAIIAVIANEPGKPALIRCTIGATLSAGLGVLGDRQLILYYAEAKAD